jgi:hypothetical protein
MILPIVRYDGASLAQILGSSFELIESRATIIKPRRAALSDSISAAFAASHKSSKHSYDPNS